MEILFWTLAAGCAAYYVTIILHAGITANFAWIWILLTGMLLICGASVRYARIRPETFRGKTALLIPVLLILVFLITLLPVPRIFTGMLTQTETETEHVIILGAQVRGTRPARALLRRLEKALEFGKNHPETVFILSGAQGPGEDITEARCMEAWLLEHGLQNRMILEERSENTRQNLEYSDKLTGCAVKRTGIITNDFHVYRSVRLAEKMGYTDVYGIPAKGDPVMEVHYILRESFALWKEKLIGNI